MVNGVTASLHSSNPSMAWVSSPHRFLHGFMNRLHRLFVAGLLCLVVRCGESSVKGASAGESRTNARTFDASGTIKELRPDGKTAAQRAHQLGFLFHLIRHASGHASGAAELCQR